LGVGRKANDLALKMKTIFAKYEDVETVSNLAKSFKQWFENSCFADGDHDYC
jgi:glycine betaine/choline ABC-type transport system substrate-binding protein